MLVGLLFSSSERAPVLKGNMNKQNVLPAHVNRDLSYRLEKRLGLDIANRSPISVITTSVLSPPTRKPCP